MNAAARVIVEADGGSRGNPGPAAFGALLRNVDTGAVIATDAEVIGVATNNVAEYRGLIAGLRLAAEHAPDAEIEVRMDSKLVIEQMAGRWKIKHPDMKPLALEAQRAVAGRTVIWTWVPREQNKAADALVNEALDGPKPDGSKPASQRWSTRFTTTPTTLVLVRHGVTDNTERKVFCGSGGADPALNPAGREQAKRAGEWARGLGSVDAVVSSPLTRTRETAAIIAETLGLEVAFEPGFAEVAFGDWDGYTFPEILERWPDELQRWLDSMTVAPPNGESIASVQKRALAARDALVADRPGDTIVVVSHVTPIKLLVADALGAPTEAVYRMDLAPASVTTIQWWPDGASSLRNFSYVP